MGIGYIVVVVVVCTTFALGGRWVQLHPEKIVPKGYFVSINCPTARLFRIVVPLMGGFFVVGAIWVATSSLLGLLTTNPTVLNWVVPVIGIVIGVCVELYVRRQAHSEPLKESDSPYGWWP